MAEPPSSALRLLRVLRRCYEGAAFPPPARSGEAATGPIALADEDDDQIETWMIGQGQGIERQPARGCSQALEPLLKICDIIRNSGASIGAPAVGP